MVPRLPAVDVFGQSSAAAYKTDDGWAAESRSGVIAAPPPETQRRWFERAIEEADRAARGQASLADLWRPLLSGELRAFLSVSKADRHFLALERVPIAERARRISERQEHVLERVLWSESQRDVASALSRGVPTITHVLGAALGKWGFDHHTCALPLLLIAIHAAHREQPNLPRVRSHELVLAERSLLLISAPRPDRVLKPLLSAAEYEVTRLLVNGGGHRELAQARKCTPRTVANQLSAAFHKLKISGRIPLLRHLVHHGDWSELRPDCPR